MSLQPSIVLDATGQGDVEFSGELYRWMEHLNVGQIMEIIVHDPRKREEIEQWCTMTGNVLVDGADDHGETLLWIRRCV